MLDPHKRFNAIHLRNIRRSFSTSTTGQGTQCQDPVLCWPSRHAYLSQTTLAMMVGHVHCMKSGRLPNDILEKNHWLLDLTFGIKMSTRAIHKYRGARYYSVNNRLSQSKCSEFRSRLGTLSAKILLLVPVMYNLYFNCIAI